MNLKRLNKQVDLEFELNSLIADEYLAWYHYHMMVPFLDNPAKDLFAEIGDDELNDHVSKLYGRMSELGYKSILIAPSVWNNVAVCKFVPDKPNATLKEIVETNINAERCAIDRYKSLIEVLTGVDEKTSDILKEILEDEEEHLKDLEDLIYIL